MIRERPLFRRRLKASWRQFLEAALKIPCQSVYGIPSALLRYLPKGQPIQLADIGAHDGDFTFGLACWCGLERSVMVEPLPHKAAQLRERFRAPQYHIFECALAADVGTAVLHVNAIEATSSLFSIRRGIAELSGLALGEEKILRVPTRTLDSVTAEAKLERIDLLKLDVQGAEHLVLAGATQALKATRLIWSECSFKPLYTGSCTFADIYETLAKVGFQLLELNTAFRSPTGELLQVDALFAPAESHAAPPELLAL